MSKTVSVALKAHLAQTVTTLAYCWSITRVDTTTYYFTTHDEDLVIDGQTYLSTVGFSASAIQTGSTGEVDNLEVLGIFEDTAIIEQDIKNGLFDYATVRLFAVNWDDLTQGIIRLRHGWLGETTRSPEGAFIAELRGLTQALVQEFGTNYSPICRADLGDSKCKVPIKPGPWAPGFTFLAGDHVQAATQSTDALLQAVFEASNGGTTGGSEPTWDTTVGNSTVDGSITWVSKNYWRVLGTVATALSQKQFISSALSFPAAPAGTGLDTSAAVGFRGDIKTGTTITVSDGVHSHSINATGDTSLSAAVGYFWAWISSFTDWQITATRVGNNVYINNASGVLGSVTKTGDTTGSVVIRDFVNNPIDGGTVTWLTGQNAGRSMEVKNYDAGSGVVTLWLGMYFPIEEDDRFMIYPGCDKRRDTCYFTFDNILNFRAEPDMPGLDAVLSYPDA
jgi:hypothetical protein